MKLISKILASRLKSVISSIVNKDQVAYVHIRFISESGQMISDVYLIRPISLLNADMKLISKILASRLKSVISSIVNKDQVAYVHNRFISESGRMISDVLEITNSLDIEELLIAVDIEKAFDSINDSFLMCVLKKLGFHSQFRK